MREVVLPWTYTPLKARSLESFIEDIVDGNSGQGRIRELDVVYLQAVGNLINHLEE